MSRLEGIVTAIKFGGSDADNVYTVVSESVVQLRSPVRLDLYDRVAVTEQGGEAKVEILGNGKAECGGLISKTVDKIEVGEPSAAYLSGAAVDVMGRMAPAMKDAARAFLSALVSGAPIIVRFHNDGDGGGGAVALYKAVGALRKKLGWSLDNIIWIINAGVSYKMDLFYSDTLLLNRYSSVVKPLIAIIDFGTSTDSEGSVRQAAGKYDFVWIDHHPISTFDHSGLTHYINPWLDGGDSNVTAGLVASCFAEMISGIDASKYKRISLTCDHSVYADAADEETNAMALVIDALTVRPEAPSGQKVTPKYIAGVFDDASRFGEILHDVKTQYAEAVDMGAKAVKQYVNTDGINIYAVDYQPIADMGFGYVTKGKYSSRMQDVFEERTGERTITLVYHSGSVSIRMSKAIAQKVGLVRIIEEMKAEADYIDSGGGHNEAASVRTDRSHMRDMLDLLLGKLGVTRN